MSLPGWLEPLETQLRQALKDGRMPHAWLIHGLPGLGKRAWAEHARRQLLCEQANACGQCGACRLLDGGAHPDSLTVEPDGKWIKVDTVRQLIHWAGLSAQQGTRKVCLIHRAQQMNLAAANALLKTLEEPSADTVFLLLADSLETVPATIRSRCRLVHLPQPAHEQALAWLEQESTATATEQALALQLAQGNPGKAARWLRDGRLPLLQNFLESVAALWQSPQTLVQAQQLAAQLEMGEVMDLCWFISSECIKIAAGQPQTDRCFCPVSAGKACDSEALYRLQRQSRVAAAMSGTGIREEGLVTDWLLNWIKAGRRS